MKTAQKKLIRTNATMVAFGIKTTLRKELYFVNSKNVNLIHFLGCI